MGKNVCLLHNPTAGDAAHAKDGLITMLEREGHTVTYASVKDKNWKKIPAETEWLAVAGGDGTVKRVIHWLHDLKPSQRKWPIGLLPLGTANNIAATLKVKGDLSSIIKHWGSRTRAFDTGVIEFGKNKNVFGEAAGLGLFPRHIISMKKNGTNATTPEDRLKADRQAMIDSARTHKPEFIELEIDGVREHGEFLLVEAMNIRSIGSNIELAPKADSGDGELGLILLRERQRKQLVDYLISVAEEKPTRHGIELIPFKELHFNAPGAKLHIDDEVPETRKRLSGIIKLSGYQLSFL